MGLQRKGNAEPFPTFAMEAEADISRFESALVNLVLNARDAMKVDASVYLNGQRSRMPTIRNNHQAPAPFGAVSLRGTGSGADRRPGVGATVGSDLAFGNKPKP
jgi:hypothetical protein